VQFRDNSTQPTFAKWNDDTTTDDWLRRVLRNAIGKNGLERHR
jgi:hypothetical protein